MIAFMCSRRRPIALNLAATNLPVFEVDYMEHYKRVCNYLESNDNLQLTRRTGMFKYYNTDHAMESGVATAANIIARNQYPAHDSLHQPTSIKSA